MTTRRASQAVMYEACKLSTLRVSFATWVQNSQRCHLCIEGEVKVCFDNAQRVDIPRYLKLDTFPIDINGTMCGEMKMKRKIYVAYNDEGGWSGRKWVVKFLYDKDVARKRDHVAVSAVQQSTRNIASMDDYIITPLVCVRPDQCITDLKQAPYVTISSFIGYDMMESVSTDRSGVWNSMPFAVTIFEQLQNGLDAIHERHIYHGDVKMENIVVDEVRQVVKLIDFGSALVVGCKELTEYDHANFTDNTMYGTRENVHPTRLSSDRRNPSRKDDLYALGAVLYRCATLRDFFIIPTDPPRRLCDYIQDRLTDANRATLVALAHDIENMLSDVQFNFVETALKQRPMWDSTWYTDLFNKLIFGKD